MCCEPNCTESVIVIVCWKLPESGFCDACCFSWAVCTMQAGAGGGSNRIRSSSSSANGTLPFRRLHMNPRYHTLEFNEKTNLGWYVAFYNLKNMLNYILIYLQMAWRTTIELTVCRIKRALLIFELLFGIIILCKMQ